MHTTCFFLVGQAWMDIPVAIEAMPSKFVAQYALMLLTLFIMLGLMVAKVGNSHATPHYTAPSSKTIPL